MCWRLYFVLTICGTAAQRLIESKQTILVMPFWGGNLLSASFMLSWLSSLHLGFLLHWISLPCDLLSFWSCWFTFSAVGREEEQFFFCCNEMLMNLPESGSRIIWLTYIGPQLSLFGFTCGVFGKKMWDEKMRHAFYLWDLAFLMGGGGVSQLCNAPSLQLKLTRWKAGWQTCSHNLLQTSEREMRLCRLSLPPVFPILTICFLCFTDVFAALVWIHVVDYACLCGPVYLWWRQRNPLHNSQVWVFVFSFLVGVGFSQQNTWKTTLDFRWIVLTETKWTIVPMVQMGESLFTLMNHFKFTWSWRASSPERILFNWDHQICRWRIKHWHCWHVKIT